VAATSARNNPHCAGYPVVVTFNDGHLKIKVGPQPEWELFAETETGFFPKAIDARVDFAKDASGAVTGLVAHLGAQDVQAKRQ
jgi:hypothetical protein